MPGVNIHQHGASVRGYQDLVRRVEADGYDRIWVGEVNDVDAVSSATLAATATQTAHVAAFLNAFTRAPTTLAMTAATLANLAPGRIEIALGVGSPMLVERWNGIPHRRLHLRLRDVLRFLRAALEGARVRAHFDTFESEGFALGAPPDEPPALLVAATGPRAIELGCRDGDGVVLNWITVDDLERIPELPDDRRRVSLMVPICPTPSREAMEQTMRPVLATYLRVPAYAGQQRRLGRAAELEQLWAADGGEARATAVPASLLDEMIVWGDPAECRRQLLEIEATAGLRAVATVFPPRGRTFADVALGGAG